jgi:hypothetical protein
MQYLNKQKNLFGEKQGQFGRDDGRFDLERMNLDRRDGGLGGDHYDPFYKNDVSYIQIEDFYF